MMRTPSKGKGQGVSKTYWLSVVTLIGIFVVNGLGFADTITGSAMGCGKDWPLCNGQLIPSVWNSAVVIEYTHRISVIAGGGLLIALAIAAWRKYGHMRSIRFFVILSLAGVMVEGALGAIAVIFVNPPAVMAAHMGIALWSLVGVGLLTYVIRQIEVPSNTTVSNAIAMGDSQLKRFARWVEWSIPYGYAAIYVGAYVASTGYGGVFQGWPFPTESPGQAGPAFWVDVLHRSVALGYLVWMMVLVRLSYRFRAIRPELFRLSCTSLILVCLQAVSGGLLIMTHLSVYAFMLHVTIVSCLYLTQCCLGLRVIQERIFRKSVLRQSMGNRVVRHRLGW